MKSDFNERKKARAERATERAQKNEELSKNTFERAKNIGSFIPMGQPILVGHHSEARHRRDLNRIDTNMRKSIEADKKAQYYRQKAKNAEDDSTIYADDPEAVKKLKEKIRGLEESHQLMKAINKHFRKHGNLQAMEGLREKTKQVLEQSVKDDPSMKVPIVSYALQNSNSNINICKKRLKQLIEAETDTTSEKVVNDVRVVDNVEDNRLQLFFDGKPEDETRALLRGNGFRWSPKVGAWQRHRSRAANWAAEKVLNSLTA